METQAPYQVTYLATPPAPCPLAAEVAATLARLRPAAEAAGLPLLALTTSYQDGRNGQPAITSYCLLATSPDTPWSKAPAEAEAPTLAEAEFWLLAQLRNQEQLAYEADPSRYVDAQVEMFQQLAGHDGC